MTALLERIHQTATMIETLATSDLGKSLHMSERLTLLELEASRYADEPVSMSELGRRIGLSRAAVTTMVDRLEDAELVERERWKGDRRRVEVSLTATGHRELVLALAPLTGDVS